MKRIFCNKNQLFGVDFCDYPKMVAWIRCPAGKSRSFWVARGDLDSYLEAYDKVGIKAVAPHR
jgi:hypothetical protein